MSATPITEDPMSAVKILNLLLEGEDRFPENFDEFKNAYCNENGLFNEQGSMMFINKVSGLISYIDRSNDRSQFSYPVMNDIILNINTEYSSNRNILELDDRISELEDVKYNLDKKLDKVRIKELTKEICDIKKEKKRLAKEKLEPKSIIDYVNKCFTKAKLKNIQTVAQ